jgi:hypothetical protein
MHIVYKKKQRIPSFVGCRLNRLLPLPHQILLYKLNVHLSKFTSKISIPFKREVVCVCIVEPTTRLSSPSYQFAVLLFHTQFSSVSAAGESTAPPRQVDTQLIVWRETATHTPTHSDG